MAIFSTFSIVFELSLSESALYLKAHRRLFMSKQFRQVLTKVEVFCLIISFTIFPSEQKSAFLRCFSNIVVLAFKSAFLLQIQLNGIHRYEFEEFVFRFLKLPSKILFLLFLKSIQKS